MGVPLEIERATPEFAPEKHPGSSCHNRQRNRFLPIHGVILTHEQEEAISTSPRLHHHRLDNWERESHGSTMRSSHNLTPVLINDTLIHSLPKAVDAPQSLLFPPRQS